MRQKNKYLLFSFDITMIIIIVGSFYMAGEEIRNQKYKPKKEELLNVSKRQHHYWVNIRVEKSHI